MALQATRKGSFGLLLLKQLWVAAAKPEQAVTLVLCAVPEGWTAAATEGCLTPEQEAISNLKPGEVRELRHAWTPGN